jgi:hypothetical protein
VLAVLLLLLLQRMMAYASTSRQTMAGDDCFRRLAVAGEYMLSISSLCLRSMHDAANAWQMMAAGTVPLSYAAAVPS